MRAAVIVLLLGCDGTDLLSVATLARIVHHPKRNQPMASTHARDHFYSSHQIDTARDRSVARAKIAADTAAFTNAGGMIQVLGITPLRGKDRCDDSATPPDRAR